MWKRYFYISFIFNIIVIVSFVLFSFVIPSLQSASHEFEDYQHPLSKKQKEDLSEIRDEFDHKKQSLIKANIENRLNFWENLMEQPVDSKKVDQSMRLLLDGEIKLKKVRYQYYIQEKLVLNHEQRVENLMPPYSKLKEYYEERDWSHISVNE